MKKNYTITPLAIGAILTLFFSVSELFASDVNEQATVTFESSWAPALNCTVPLSRAEEIYELLPESFTSACDKEYRWVRNRCGVDRDFSYKGVKIHVIANDGRTVSVEFTYQSNDVLVQNASWEDLDKMFHRAAL